MKILTWFLIIMFQIGALVVLPFVTIFILIDKWLTWAETNRKRIVDELNNI